MTDQKKHTDLFEELIRTLSLKKQFRPQSMESFVASVDKSYMPDNEKIEKLFDELDVFYRTQKPSRKYPLILWAIFLSVILIGILFLNPRQMVETQSEKPMLDSIQTEKINEKSLDKNKIISNEIIKDDSIIGVNKDNSNKISPTIKNIDTFDLELQKVREQSLLNGTILEKIPISTIPLEEETDKILFFERKDCNLPENYTIYFSKKSRDIKEINKDDLMEIAQKIKNCQNIGIIKLEVFYTRKFFFFSNKKIASERIDSILKNLRKNGVTIRMLRKKQIEFIRIQKNEYTDFFEKVEISMDY